VDYIQNEHRTQPTVQTGTTPVTDNDWPNNSVQKRAIYIVY